MLNDLALKFVSPEVYYRNKIILQKNLVNV